MGIRAKTVRRSYCPRCGGLLLYNGAGMACLQCSFLETAQDPQPPTPLPPPEKRKDG